MFKTSRPRVPSKAALRALYQLAYISSGTAVGIVTLCAEERRRRTQLVQKIADNARCIQQSPKHVHNATRYSALDGMGDSQRESWNIRHPVDRDGASKKKKASRSEWSARAADLPSKVESGYERLRKRNKQRQIVRSDFPVRLSKNSSKNLLYAAKDQNKDSRPNFVLNGYHNQMDLRNDAQMVIATSAEPEEESVAASVAVREYRRGSADQQLKPTGPGEHVLQEDGGHLPRPGTKAVRSDQLARDPTKSVTHELEIFFRRSPTSWRTPEARSEHASRLLQLALDHGHLSEVRSIYLWKSRVATLSEEDVCNICDSCGLLSLNTNHEELLDFFEELFEASRLLRMSNETRAYCALMVRADSVWWNLPSDTSDNRRNRLRGVFHQIDPETIDSALHRVCKKLMRSGKPGDAIKLVTSVQEYFRDWLGHQVHFRKLEEQIFSSALSAGQLWCCKDILQYHLKQMPAGIVDDELFSWTQALLQKAYRQGQFEPIASMLSHAASRTFFARICIKLQDSEKVCLANACTETGPYCHKIWDMLFDSMSGVHRDTIIEFRTTGKLRKIWKTTHNLDRVHAAFEEAVLWIESVHLPNRSTMLDLRLAMVEILNSAKKPEQAMQMLRNISKHFSHSSSTLSTIAVTLAAQGSWKDLERLVELLGRWPKFTVNDAVHDNLDKVLDRYSAQHNAGQTWSFVTMLMNKLGFVPSPSTNMIMLKCFVTKQTLDMIPSWLQLMEVRGHALALDSYVALRLLEHYYLQHRPSHKLVLEFSRRLTDSVPLLKPASFRNLIKHAIGHDLRNYRNQSALRHTAHQNLALLQQMPQQIPLPVRKATAKRPPITYRYLTPPTADDTRSNGTSLKAIGRQTSISQHVAINSEHAENDVLEAWNSLEEIEPHETEPSSDPRDLTTTFDWPRPDSATEDLSTWPLTQVTDSKTNTEISDSFSVVPGIVTDYDQAAIFRDTAEEPSIGLDEPSSNLREVRMDSDKKQIEHDMVLALSTQDYQKVLDLYRQNISVSGLPSSRIVLQVVVEASVRLHKGDRREAEEMISNARSAGMDVTSAIGQLLMQQIWDFKPEEKREASNLRTTVLEYYKMLIESGQPVTHHLGLTAANVLVNNHRPEHALNLMDSIYKSSLGAGQPLTIIGMTIYLKAFISIRSMQGLQWVIETVLTKDVRIDKRFLDTLRSSSKSFASGPPAEVVNSTGAADLVAQIRRWYRTCQERRYEQQHRAVKLGWEMVYVLGKCANISQQTAMISTTQESIGEASLGLSATGTSFHVPQQEQHVLQTPVV